MAATMGASTTHRGLYLSLNATCTNDTRVSMHKLKVGIANTELMYEISH